MKKKKTTFAERVQIVIEKENLNPSTLAKKLNVPPQSMRNIIAGRNNPSYDTIVSLLNLFNWLTADWLVLGIEPEEPKSNPEKLYAIIEKQHNTIDRQQNTIDMLTRRLVNDTPINNPTSQKIG